MDPLQTTVRGLCESGNARPVVQRIQNKIVTYGVCSDAELAFLIKHCDIGEIRQKDSII